MAVAAVPARKHARDATAGRSRPPQAPPESPSKRRKKAKKLTEEDGDDEGDTPVSAQARPAAAYVKSLPAGAAAVSSPCDGGIAVDESRSGLAAGESDEGETGEEESADESQAAEGEADESDGNESEDFEGEDDGHYVEDDYIENDAFPEEEDRREEVAVDDDEDEEDGVGDAAAVRGKKRKGLYGVPSNEELQGLKETSELFKSNLFKFQLDELLAEVRYDYAKAKSLDAALVKLKDVLDSAVDRPGLLPSEAAGSLLGEGITVPFPTPGPPANAQYKLAFMAPASIRVVGSYPLKAVAVTKHRFNVDVTVEMPKELFQEKDRVNHRYFYKRAYYLAVIAAELSKPERGFPGAKLEFCTDDDDDPRRPILLLRPSGDRSPTDFSKARCVIRILPIVSPEVFPSSKLAPAKNNVRPPADTSAAGHGTPGDGGSNPPTPLYNSSLLRDMNHAAHLAHIYQHMKTCPALADVFVLAKVWLGQRGLARHSFLIKMLTTHLLAGGAGPNRKLAAGFSSYQLLRGTLVFLAEHDFAREPVFVGGAPQPPGDFSGEAFSANHDVVVVDNTGRLNIAAWMSKSDMAELQHEAKLAMKFLDETAADRFAALFLYRVDRPELKFDNVLRIPIPEAIPPLYNLASQLDIPCQAAFLRRKIPDLLVRGLRDRVPLVTARLERTPSWRLQDARPQNKRAELLVGLLLNPDHAPRLVDHGPPAEDAKACEDFRRLWGNKSELRRFQNGQIGESVVWACGDAEKRLMIPTRAALYLLQRHVFIEPQSVECWAGSALVNLLRPAARVPRAARIESSELVAAGFKTVMKSFDAFAKMIRGFDGLPFAVSAVTPASSALRYSSLFVPRPRDVSEWSSVPSTCQFIEPIETIVQLEGNTRWPDDLAAIRQTKLGFYIKFAELFEKAFPGSVRTAVAAAHGDEEGYLDVAGGSGFVFRVRIQQEREAFLMEREIKDSTTPAGRKTGLQRLLHGYRRRYEHVPTHTNLLQALCQHHPSLSGSIRLAKRWLAAHCVLGEPHVSEELAELLTARPFTDPAPHTIPASPQAGFARFLYHLAEWDWKAEPASVDLEHAEGCSSSCGGAWTEALRAEADEKFAALRAEEETAARASGTATRRTRTWIVQTPRDTAGTAWTAPAPVVARRIRTLAKAAVKLLRESIVSGCERNIVNLFGHPTDAYDVLLCLDEEKLTRRYEAVSPTASLLRSKRSSELRAGKEEGPASENCMPMVGWDPANEFLNDLQRTYSNVAHFFQDRYGGSTVFVLWDPSVREPRPWKANLAFSTRTVGGSDDDDGCGGGDTGESGAKGGGKVTSAKEKKKKKKIPVPHAAANLDAIVSEMTRIGGGLVREVLSQS